MTNALISPAASGPPASAAPQAAGPARETGESQVGSSFKKALAAAQKPDAEKPVDSAPQPADPGAKKAETAAADEADENNPVRQALLTAMAVLASSAASAQVLAANDTAPAAAAQPAELSMAPAQQSAIVVAADDQLQLAAPAQTEATAQAAQPAQFAELLKAQAQPEAEAKTQAETKSQAGTKVAVETAPAAAQPLIMAMDGNKLAAAKSALEVLADELKPEVEKPPAAAEKPVAPPLDPGLVKAATPFNVNELARLSEARPNSPLPMMAQIQQGVDTLTKSGQTSLRLQLYPEALGRVDLRLTSGADGVRVSLTADLSATGNLLERHAQELRQALSDSGLTVASLSIGFSLGQGKSSNAFEWQPPASGRASTGQLSAVEPALDGIAPLRTPDAGRVDYRI